ncbi:MAG TPA: PAS domain S-box protein [Polyangiales bacterium]
MSSATRPSIETALSSDDWRLLIEAVQDYAIFMLDPQGILISWNRGAEAITGYRASEIIGRHCSVLYPQDAGEEIGQQLELAQQQGRLEREGWRVRKDGARFWADVVITALRDAGGELRGFATVARDLTRRRTAEDALRGSEERMRLLIEAVTDHAIYMLDPEGRVSTWNTGAQRLKGYSAQEIIGQSYARFFTPADQAADKPGRELAIARSEGHFAEEGFRVRKDGTQFWASVVLTPIVDAAGTLLGFAKVTRDLTARMRAEETSRQLLREQSSRALAEANEAYARESEERSRSVSRRLSAVLEGVADGITVQDRSLRLVFANTAAARACGFDSLDEFLRQGHQLFAQMFELRDEQGALLDLDTLPGRRALRGEGPSSLLVHVRERRTQLESWWMLRSTPVLGPAGDPELAVNVVRDITIERRRERYDRYVAEVTAALAESLDVPALLARLTTLLVPGLADFCCIYLIERGSPALSAFAHVDPAACERVRALVERVVPDPAQPRGIFSVLNSAASQLYTEFSEEDLTQLAGGSAERLAALRELDMRSVLIAPLSVQGRVLGCMALVHNQSERRYRPHDMVLADELGRRAGIAVENAYLYAAERAARDQVEQAARRAEEANRLKDEFLATLSHELRTPLNAILGWASVLRTGSLEQNAAKAVEVIHRNAHAQARIIDDLLDVSRIITGKLKLELRHVDLVAIVRDAMEVVRPSAHAKNMDLRFEPELEHSMLVADPGRLQQVTWNLLSNAVKFSQPGASIRVELELESDHVTISVSDTGPGIEPEFLPFVFERFRQADSSATRRVGGLGLGLAIVRYLVELHGGEVSAHSEGANKGATFRVRLPQRSEVQSVAGGKSAKRAQAEPAAPRITLELAGRRVLVVDDESDARELLSAVLVEAGAVVETAGSTAEALTTLTRFRPQVLVSDIGMPGEDGYSLIRRVNALSAALGGGIPSLALTAYAGSDDKARALAMGFTTYLSKPVQPEDLVAAVANLAAFVHR